MTNILHPSVQPRPSYDGGMQNIRFEVRINEEVVTTAGVDGYGVLTAILSWVLHDPDRIPEHVRSGTVDEQAEWLQEDLRIQVGGLGSAGNLDWADQRLKLGDEVRIRVMPPGPVDEAEVRPAMCGDPADG